MGFEKIRIELNSLKLIISYHKSWFLHTKSIVNDWVSAMNMIHNFFPFQQILVVV